ncbi:MAG: primosomal protein N' [Patescibacteria group bacterium]|nr:primosomal protein N' [Patescibacteria group bacterium]MDD5490481.1 primosomal protein N' [Patescibacteria group bacterium]
MIAEIIPAIKLPRNFTYFDYLVPEELKSSLRVGQIVQIPFRGQKIEGLVYNIKKGSESKFKKLKAIIKIPINPPVFDREDIELIKWLANYYFISWGLSAKQFIPDFPKRKSQSQEIITSNLSINFEVKPRPRGLGYFQYKNQDEKHSFYLDTVRKNQGQNRQTLFLSPTISGAIELNNFFIQHFKGQTSLLLNNLSKGSFYTEWLNILNNKKSIIIGTRSAIFSPLKNIGAIVLDEEFSDDFKQEEPNPRYDARSLAIQINKLKNISVIFSSPLPRLEMYPQIKSGKIKILSSTEIKYDNLKIIDLNEEIRAGNYSLLSDFLEEKIAGVLKNKKQTLLFLNRRGGATYIYCGDCSYVFSCGECQLPLAEYGKILRCRHCNKEFPFPLACPACSGTNLKFSGKGTQKVEFFIKNKFPDAISLRLDADVDKKDLDQKILAKADIIIGTNFIWQRLDWSKIGLVGVLNFDNFINHQDFRTREKQGHFLANLKTHFDGPLVIQTHSLDNPVFQYLKNGDWQEFFNKELEIRNSFSYPPYSHLIKLIYQDSNDKKAERESAKIYKLLASKIKGLAGVELIPPIQYYGLKIRGKYRWNLVLKVRQDSWNKIYEILKVVPANWLIDIDPSNLL